jgi:hypothetical protein
MSMAEARSTGRNAFNMLSNSKRFMSQTLYAVHKMVENVAVATQKPFRLSDSGKEKKPHKTTQRTGGVSDEHPGST